MTLACPESLSVITSGQCGGASDPTATAPAGAGLRAGRRVID